MKKTTLLLIFLGAFTLANARTVDVAASYTGASHFDQVHASATLAPALNTLVGVEAKLTNERAFKDPIYSVAVPLSLDLEMLRFSFRPFYYFKNKSDDPAFQDSYAFGINGQMRIMLLNDEVNDIYNYAFVAASFARQQGTVFYENGPAQDRYYSQAAYQLGLSQTLFNAFGFDAIGTVFQYPDGVSQVTGLRSVMDQQELANTQTLDIVHQLTKYTIGGRLTRLWADNGSTLYVGYRYGSYHNASPEHSILVGNSFTVSQRISVDLAYNHVRTIHNKNRRDIFYIQLATFF